MGWAGGSSLAQAVWNAVVDYIPEDKRVEVALEIVDKFEGEDCDTMDECDFVQELLIYDEGTNAYRARTEFDNASDDEEELAERDDLDADDADTDDDSDDRDEDDEEPAERDDH